MTRFVGTGCIVEIVVCFSALGDHERATSTYESVFNLLALVRVPRPDPPPRVHLDFSTPAKATSAVSMVSWRRSVTRLAG